LIERFYLKDCLVFKEVELEFDKGLILFSGASGVGKSILLNALLGVFGYKDTDASLAEVSLDNKLNMEEIGIENEESNIFKFVKTKSARYFINGSQVPKKTVKNISKNLLDYLSPKEYKEFENHRLLDIVDTIISQSDKEYDSFLKTFKRVYGDYQKIAGKLQEILEKEKKIEELKEFAAFEISKIEEISPKIGEYEELMQIKKSLSRKEKISEALQNAKMIFEYEHFANEALELLEIDSTFFDESLNELRAHLENAEERINELEDIDIEEVLDRIEKLSYLKQRYGSIEESLKYLERKKEELQYYNNISYEKSELQKKKETLLKKCDEMCGVITKKRESALEKLNFTINEYLKMLYLPDIKLSLKQTDMSEYAKDEVDINLWGIGLDKISSGEFNRVRLAFLSAFNDISNTEQNGILILDEVDANLSGKESMSIAYVLQKLSDNYQIFAISHQPQLTSKADMHFLVYKEDGISKVKELKDKKSKIDELARMISGEKIHQKAKEFAKSLVEG
jgi:DNA repair protein RecN (Recombination protein N)